MKAGRTAVTGVACVIDVRTTCPGWKRAIPDLEDATRRALTASALHQGHACRIDVLFTDDVHMRSLNRRWRDRDKSTDILSFAAAAIAGPADSFLGDLVLASGVTLSDAARLGREAEAHLAHLLVHGFLHLLGYTHCDEAQARIMEGLERDILADLHIADPYQDAI